MNHYHHSTALRCQVIHLGVRKTWTTKKIRIAESGQNLINRISFAVNRLGYSKRTEQTYRYWIKYFLNYNRTTPAQGLCTEDINRFLQHISNRNKSASTLNAAINAINFFFKHVLEREMGQLDPILRPKSPTNLPVVFTHQEAMKILRAMHGTHRLMASILYGSGLRISEFNWEWKTWIYLWELSMLSAPKVRKTVSRYSLRNLLGHCLNKYNGGSLCTTMA